MSEKGFTAAVRALGVADRPSPLDPSFRRLLPFLEKMVAISNTKLTYRGHPAGFDELRPQKRLAGMKKAELPGFVHAATVALRWVRAAEHRDPGVAEQRSCIAFLTDAILLLGVRKAPWEAEDLNGFVRAVAPPALSGKRAGLVSHYETLPATIVGELLMRDGYDEMLDDTSRSVLARVRELVTSSSPSPLERKRLMALDRAIAATPAPSPPRPKKPQSAKTGSDPVFAEPGAARSRAAAMRPFYEVRAWAKEANRVLARMGTAHRPALDEICRHATTCDASRPSPEWSARARELLVRPLPRPVLVRMLGGVIDSAVRHLAFAHDPFAPVADGHYERDEANIHRLLGLVCFAGLSGDKTLLKKLAHAVEATAAAKVKFRHQLVPFATTCVRAMALAESPPVELLERLRSRVSWAPIRKALDKALSNAARAR